MKPGIITAAISALGMSLNPMAHAASMAQVPDIPTTDLLLSRGNEAGLGTAASQATFGYRNADALGSEGTRGRGQSFVIDSQPGASYEISALTVALAGGAGTAIRPDGDLTLTIFEYIGTGATAADQANDTADWVTKTGGTSGTELFKTSFEVAAGTTFSNANLLTFSFDPGELELDDDKAYGFFLQYVLDDVTGLTGDVTIAFDSDNNSPDNPVGRLLSTNPTVDGQALAPNNVSDSRDLNYFIQGTPLNALVESTIMPSATVIELGGSVNLDISFDPTVDSATLDTPTGPVDLLALDDGNTNGDSTAGDGEVTLSETPTTTFDYVVDATKAGSPSSAASAEIFVVDPSTEAADNAFSSAIKADSPLFYYRFEEPTDARVLLDSSGNSNHTADIVGGIVQGTEPGGMQRAAELTGNVGILVPATSTMNQSFTLTAVANLKDGQTGSLRSLFSMTDGNDTGRSIFYFGTGILRTFIDGTTITNSGASVVPPNTSCLYHMVYDADPDSNPSTEDQVVRFYINGQLDGESAVGAVAANIGEWVLGSSKFRNGQFLNGWLDETAVFESALSGSQIATHASAFFAAADPLLGLTSDVTAINTGESATLSWKISDLATVVTINGIAQTITSGGVYNTVLNPTASTTYTLEVSGPGGPFTRSVDITVFAPPAITGISADGATPPNITIEMTGTPNTTYEVNASTDLLDGFPVNVSTITTDANGVGSTTFEGLGTSEFYRVETQ